MIEHECLNGCKLPKNCQKPKLMHTQLTSFPPIANPQATILVLGSMPGVASLAAQQYYAHPRNAFWPILASIYSIDITSDYESRVSALQQTDIAVWDVLKHCERKGSLDSAIQADTTLVNDFKAFFKVHSCIKSVVFNGAEAEKQFKRGVLSTMDLSDKAMKRAPSTSPAHTLSFEAKLSAWQTVLAK